MISRAIVVRNGRILDIAVRTIDRFDLPGTIVSAAVSHGRVGIAHLFPRSMSVARIVAAIERDWFQSEGLHSSRLVGKTAGRDVVATGRDRIGSACCQSGCTFWNRAERGKEMEEIIGRAILLKDDDYVLDLRRKKSRLRFLGDQISGEQTRRKNQ